MVMPLGSKVLINHRRLFADDHARYFIGVAEAYEHGMIRVSGFTWIRDQLNASFQKRAEQRTKIMSLASGTLICYLLPQEIEPSRVVVETTDNRIWLRDDSSGFKMELTEGIYPKPSAGRSDKK